MTDLSCTSRTVGGTSHRRQRAAAVVLLFGAVGCAVAGLANWPLYQTLIVLGAAATTAWLVDGTSQRFMGPGLLALAVGGGITLYTALDMDPKKGEHSIVYPLVGGALLLASLFNPLSIRGAGTFLLVVGAVAAVDTPWKAAWTVAALLALWGVLEVGRVARTASGRDADSIDLTSDGRERREPPVHAGG